MRSCCPIVWVIQGSQHGAQAGLTDVLERIVSGGTKRYQPDTLLPWNWDGPRSGQIADTA